jgi:hypothetical protein
MAEEKTTFKFTQYCFDSFKRFLKVSVAEAKKMTLDEFENYDSDCCGLPSFRQHIVNGFVFRILIDLEYEDDDVESTLESATLNFELFSGVNKGHISGRKIGVFTETGWHDFHGHQERLKEDLQSYVGVEFKKCKQPFCDRIQPLYVYTEGWCKTCYVSCHKREEKCPVCLEDEGSWITLYPCQHVLHSACWTKTVGRKCPMCRTECDYSKSTEF